MQGDDQEALIAADVGSGVPPRLGTADVGRRGFTPRDSLARRVVMAVRRHFQPAMLAKHMLAPCRVAPHGRRELAEDLHRLREHQRLVGE